MQRRGRQNRNNGHQTATGEEAIANGEEHKAHGRDMENSDAALVSSMGKTGNGKKN
jgi:hypothetical protein